MDRFETFQYYSLVEQALGLLNGIKTQNLENSETKQNLIQLINQHYIAPKNLCNILKAWGNISPEQFFQYLNKKHTVNLIKSKEKKFAGFTPVHLINSNTNTGSIQFKENDYFFEIGQACTPFGQAFVCSSSKGINSLVFQTDEMNYQKWQEELSKKYPACKLSEKNQLAEKMIDHAFHPSAQKGLEIDLCPQGTPFQIKVWQTLLHIRPGELVSYQQVANHIGTPTASRAVGTAIAKNPIAFLIPCHRVIHSSGKFGQYRWESNRKKALHIWEQALINTI